MSKKSENQGFICTNCYAKVNPLENGSYRNHCPFCLHSLHIDLKPGDRKSICKGLLKPIGLKNNSKKGMQIIFKCLKCGNIKVNKVARDDLQEDDLTELLKLM